MKIVTLTEQEFDNYARTHRYRSYYQTSKYGNLIKQNGFNIHYLGFKDKADQLIGASLILYRDLLLGFKYAYAPRGFLLNYNNSTAITEITKELQKLLFKQKYVFIKLDPLIISSRRDKKGNTIYFNSEINDILNTFNKTKYQHKGFNKYFENLKPRWQAILPMTPNTSSLYNTFSKNIRNKINKASRLGLEIYQSKEDTDIELFYEFVKNKDGKSLKYYQDFRDIYKDDFEIYFVKADFGVIVKTAKKLFEKESQYNDHLTKQIQDSGVKGKDLPTILNKKMASDLVVNNHKNNMIEATQLLNSYNEGLVIGAIAIIKHDGEIFTLIEGFDKKFSKYNGNYLLRWHLIEKFAKQGYVKYNLNAITGDFTNKGKYSGLNESKLSFGAQAVEYIGEFNYIINPIIYAIYNFKPIRKRVNKRAE